MIIFNVVPSTERIKLAVPPVVPTHVIIAHKITLEVMGTVKVALVEGVVIKPALIENHHGVLTP